MKDVSVLITGCSSGFGFETALLFARKRYKTFATVRNLTSDGATKLEEIAKTENLNLTILQLDVTKDISVSKALDSILKKTDHIDILVNNAGFAYLGPVEDFTIEQIQQQYDVNIFGAIRMIKKVVPVMRKYHKGTIINISSINGLIPFPLYSIYSSSKFAIETLSEGLRFELHPFGIKVALVEPGSFLTSFSANRKFSNTSDSHYMAWTQRFFGKVQTFHSVLDRFSESLFSPKRVARRIVKVAENPNPNLRNVVGIDAHILLFLRSILPYSVRFWLLQKAYKWK